MMAALMTAEELRTAQDEVKKLYHWMNIQGVSHARMARATGLPESTFSMWLTGYRPLVKVAALQAVLAGVEELQREVEDDRLDGMLAPRRRHAAQRITVAGRWR